MAFCNLDLYYRGEMLQYLKQIGVNCKVLLDCAQPALTTKQFWFVDYHNRNFKKVFRLYVNLLFFGFIWEGGGAREKRFLVQEIPECSLSPGGAQCIAMCLHLLDHPKTQRKKFFFYFMNVYNELGKGKVQTPRPKDL